MSFHLKNTYWEEELCVFIVAYYCSDIYKKQDYTVRM